jgi:uncharacterized protein (TIGR02186 family)
LKKLLYIIGFMMITMLPHRALATLLVADLSVREIEIDSSFKGLDILLFGAAGGDGEIIITVTGPKANYVVRKKSRVGGIWMNTDSQAFPDVPKFYAFAGEPRLVADGSRILADLSFGSENIFPASSNPENSQEEFENAFIKLKNRNQLIDMQAGEISFMAETLFRTVLHFPEKTPRGMYSINVFLLDSGVIKASHTIPLEVKKIGLDAFIYDLAHGYPLLYGILAIILAISGGLAAAQIFRKL